MDAGARTTTADVRRHLDVLRACTDDLAELQAAVDPVRVADQLRRAVPDLDRGAVRLVSCDLTGVRFRRGAWQARYAVRVAAGNGTSRTVALLAELGGTASEDRLDGWTPGAAFGDDDWAVRTARPAMSIRTDRRPPLAGLRALGDPGTMRAVMERSLRSQAFPALVITDVALRVARDVPGQRRTVVCHLQYPAGADPRWPAVVVAKAYRGPEGGRTLDVMRALWDTALSAGRHPKVAEPLDYLPAHRLLLQRGLAGDRTLKDLVLAPRDDGAGTEAATAATADALVAVHSSGVDVGEEWTWADDMALLGRDIARTRETNAGVANAVAAIAELVDRRQQAVRSEPLLPAHGAFRPAQVLVHDCGVGIVDFDGFRRSEPARDVARFRKALHKSAASVPASTVPASTVQGSTVQGSTVQGPAPSPSPSPSPADPAAMADLFLARYQDQASLSRDRVILWESMDLLKAIPHAWLRGHPQSVRPLADLLERALAPLL